jgi:hypothetical protein
MFRLQISDFRLLMSFFSYRLSEIINNVTGKKSMQKQDEVSQEPFQPQGDALLAMQKVRKS